MSLLSVACIAASQDVARAEMLPIMKRAIAEFPRLKYTGIRVVQFREGPNGTKHTEQIIRDGPNSRVEFPAGSPFAGQVIVENGRERHHFFPDLREVHVLPARREEAFGRLFKFMHHKRGESKRRLDFRVSSAVGAVVAGIRTEQVIVAAPSGNVIQRLHIDPRSGMLLKREMFDHVGTPVGGFEFTQIDLTPRIDPRVFVLHVRGAKWLRADELAARLARQNGFLPLTLPTNERLELEHSRIFEIERVPVLAQIYISPRGRLSLFQIKGEIEPQKLRRQARGEFNTHAWRFQGRNFVLIGEQDPAELQRLAKRLTER